MTIVKIPSPDRRYKPPANTIRDLPKGKVQQLQAVFSMLDTDRDGLLREEEVVYSGKLLGLRIPLPEHTIDATPRSCISEDSAPVEVGFWNFEEFAGRVATAMHRHHNDVDDMANKTEKMFNAMDKYQRGSITGGDISAFFSSCGDVVSEELVEAMLDAMDTSLMGEKASKPELRTFLETCEHRYANPIDMCAPACPFSMHQSLLEAQLNAREYLESVQTEVEEEAAGGALVNLVAMSAGAAGREPSAGSMRPRSSQKKPATVDDPSSNCIQAGAEGSDDSRSSRSSLSGSESGAGSEALGGGDDAAAEESPEAALESSEGSEEEAEASGEESSAMDFMAKSLSGGDSSDDEL